MVKAVKPKKSLQERIAERKANKIDNLTVLSTLPHCSWACFRPGAALAEDWYAVCFRLSVGLEMARFFHDEEELCGLFDLSMQAMHDVYARALKGDLFQAAPEELALVGAALNLTDEMQDLCSVAEQRQAMYDAATEMNILQAALAELNKG